jgi:hypothetical protein
MFCRLRKCQFDRSKYTTGYVDMRIFLHVSPNQPLNTKFTYNFEIFIVMNTQF